MVSFAQRFVSLAKTESDLRVPLSCFMVKTASGHSRNSHILNQPTGKSDIIAKLKVTNVAHNVIGSGRSVADKPVGFKNLKK